MAKFHIMNFTPELLEHKKKYGDDWENHALKMISADEEEAKKGLFGYICPLCGLSYFFSDKSDAQEKADTMQKEHLKSCDHRLKDGKLYWKRSWKKLIIDVFSKNDLNNTGTLKKRNNMKEFTEEEFVKYVKENKLTLSKGYIDIIGYIDNGMMFKCYHRNIIVGVTGIIDKINGT